MAVPLSWISVTSVVSLVLFPEASYSVVVFSVPAAFESVVVTVPSVLETVVMELSYRSDCLTVTVPVAGSVVVAMEDPSEYVVVVVMVMFSLTVDWVWVGTGVLTCRPSDVESVVLGVEPVVPDVASVVLDVEPGLVTSPHPFPL